MDELFLIGIVSVLAFVFLWILALIAERYAKKVAKKKKDKILAKELLDRVNYEKLRSRNEYYCPPIQKNRQSDVIYEDRQSKYIKMINKNVTKNSKQLAKDKYEKLRNLKNIK